MEEHIESERRSEHTVAWKWGQHSPTKAAFEHLNQTV